MHVFFFADTTKRGKEMICLIRCFLASEGCLNCTKRHADVGMEVPQSGFEPATLWSETTLLIPRHTRQFQGRYWLANRQAIILQTGIHLIVAYGSASLSENKPFDSGFLRTNRRLQNTVLRSVKRFPTIRCPTNSLLQTIL